ncbi:MAG TPA: peptidoglycan-binding protein [Streptosporangiaceae bacterium]|nr:peptidoglycan-binding protein [Streptosporangiaceae bacterium]
MSRRLWGTTVPLAAAAATGAVAAVAVGGSRATPVTPAPPHMSTATVVRTTLVASLTTGGTLGFAPSLPVVNGLTGTYTWLPAPGATVRPGHTLYRVDDQRVVLMAGRIPAWRPFAPGMTSGRDVRQLQANLIAEGFADGLFSAPSGQYDQLTVDAVEQWQTANGYPMTGQIPLGTMVFLPEAVRVGSVAVTTGQPAAPGQQPYQVTSGRRVVTVPLTPNLPPVTIGETVSVVLPSGASTPGKVTGIGAVPPPAAGAASPPSAATQQFTVTPRHPRGSTGTGMDVAVQVSLPVQSAKGVLAVPVSALLALAGGGYGLETVTPSGIHHLVGVRTGLFADGRVQVSGPGIAAGTTVVVAQ